MGKSKQRTKNNTKPSNSQRSADLLAESGFTFSGFSNLNLPETGFVSCLKNVDMNHVDPNFQLLLRKMNKKDRTTKYKALQEFADLCKSAELSQVEATLPFWPRLYCSLAIDIDHRVREAAQTAHAALIKRLGKKIVTHLKQFAGAWFVSQYDTYPPASSAAQNSFQDTFPPNKVINAIVHCQDEILNYIRQNITVETPQSLSLNKSLTPEEMEAKYQRVLISNMQAYTAYLKTVGEDEIEKTREIHQKIMSDGKFWKLGKHTEAPIKAAFYDVLTAIMKHRKCLLENDKKKIVTTIMNKLDETEPSLVIAIWEAVIVAINVIEDWHKLLSVEKTVLPKIYFIVKNSGQNCATIVYPNLLPLLNHLMKLDIDKPVFYTRLFDNMREGMQIKQVAIGRSEVQTIITTFFECYRFVIHNNSADFEMCNNLMKEQLFPVIKSTFAECAAHKQMYFSELASMIRYWSKNRNTDSNCYSELIKSFWLELAQLHAEFQEADESSTLTNLCNLLASLKSPSATIRRKMRVTFSDSTESEKSEGHSDIKIVDSDKQFNDEVDDFILSFCEAYFAKVIDSPNKKNYANLMKLASSFGSKPFFQKIARVHNADSDLVRFYEDNLRNWMLANRGDAKEVVPLVFIILNYVNVEGQNKILLSLLKFEDKDFLYSAVKCALSNKGSDVIKNWCHNEAVTNLLVEVAQDLVSKDHTKEFARNNELILMAFTVSKNKELFISDNAVNAISSVICKALTKMCSAPLEFVMPVAKISSGTEEESDPLEIIDTSQLMLSNLVKTTLDLLELTLNYSITLPGCIEMLQTVLLLNITDDLTKDFETESESWQQILSSMIPKMSHEQFIDLIKNFATTLWKKVFETSGIGVKDSLIQIASTFINVIYDNRDEEEFSELALLFLSTLDVRSWIKNVYNIVLSAEIMNGNLFMPGLDVEVNIWNEDHFIKIINDNVDDSIDKCLKWAIASMKILNKLNDYVKESDEDVFINIPVITTSVIDIIKLACKYKLYYKSNKLFNYVNCTLDVLTSEFDVVRPSKKFYSEDISDTLNQVKTSSIPENEDVFALINIRNRDSEEKNQLEFNRLMDKIVQRHYIEPSILLQECNIHTVTWEKLTLPLELIRTITHYINKYPKNITSFQWDFILISLASWQQSVNQSKNHYNDFKVMTFTIAVSQLYCAIQTLMLTHEKEPIEEIPPELLDEWKNVFMDSIHAGIAKTWMLYSDLYNQKEIPIMTTILLDSLSQAMQLLDKNLFFKQSAEISVSFTELMKISLKLLQSPIPNLQLSAYHALRHVIKELVNQDKAKISIENFDAKALNIYQFENILLDTRNLMDAMLKDMKLCDPYNCVVEPYSETYISTLGYLFSWSIVLEMCADADGDLRYYYAEMLKNDHFSCLINNIFKLIPSKVLLDSKVKLPKLIELFNSPSLNFGENWSTLKLNNMVCWVYANCLRILPVLVRQWWSTTDSRVSVTVERITTVYVSPMLCQEELNNKKLSGIENIQVKIHHSTREVIATYEMDDLKLELSIALPVNYPLGPVTVMPGQNVRGSTNWSNCHMQLSLFLTHQNGSIWEGLMLWKKNLDKRFNGVEECYICFSIMHFNTYQLPKLSCRTCKKKFHTACLYKWFNTSHKSTCPICRNIF